jgi:opacity protein-like surface antigen
MKRCALALLCGSALISIAGISAASAADLSYKAPTGYAPVAAHSWTGLYAGFNVGYGFGAGGRDDGGQTNYVNNSPGNVFPFNTETHGTGGPAWGTSADLKGALGGGQIGYNFQMSPWLVGGLEADFQGSALKGDSSAANTTAITLQPFPVGGPNLWPVAGAMASSQSIDWYGTVRGRLGVTSFDQTLLVYGTGGLAYGQVRQSFAYAGGFLPDAALGFGGSHWTGSASSTDTKVGWTVGAGFEWAPQSMPNWSVKTEYLYTDLGAGTVNLTAPAFRNSDGEGFRTVSASNSMDTRFQTVRVGLNYHFH